MAKRQSMRDKMRSKLKDRTKESHGRGSGGNFKDYFDASKMEGLNKWWAGKGEHIIDIIPYFAGPNDPFNKEGEPAYVLDIEVHQKVGVGEDQVVCPVQFNKPCPICEDMRNKRNEGQDYKTVLKPLMPKRRTVYNVIVRDGAAMEAKGNQIFEIAHFFMENHLAKISKDARGGGYVVFSDPDEGRSISFEREGTGATSTKYVAHRFSDRPEPITEEELEAAVCLDELIKIHTYDEIYAMYYGVSAPDTEEDDPVDEEVCPDCDEDPCVCNEAADEPEPEQEQPAPRRTAAEKKAAREARKAEKAKKAGKVVCPAGGTMGDDIDEFNECPDCEHYDACEEAAG